MLVVSGDASCSAAVFSSVVPDACMRGRFGQVGPSAAAVGGYVKQVQQAGEVQVT